MKSNLVFSLLLLINFKVFGASNWVLIGKSDLGDEFFLDQNSIKKNGDVINFWRRQNFANKTEEGNLSSKVHASINCRTSEQLTRTMIFYDKKNNLGKITKNFTVNDSWKPIPSGAVSWYFLQQVCV